MIVGPNGSIRDELLQGSRVFGQAIDAAESMVIVISEGRKTLIPWAQVEYIEALELPG